MSIDPNPRPRALKQPTPIQRITLENPKERVTEGVRYTDYTAYLDGNPLGTITRIDSGFRKRLYSVNGRYYSGYLAKQTIYEQASREP